MVIYRITNTINGKVYIGRTERTGKIRFQESCGKARAGKNTCMPLIRAIIEHGPDAFTVEEIASAATLDELKSLEQLHIAAHDSIRNGYNVSIGGNSGLGVVRSQAFKDNQAKRMTGFKHTAETRRKLSDAKKGIAPSAAIEGIQRAWDDPTKREAFSAVRKGRKWTETQREKNIAARLGKKRGETLHTRKMRERMAIECGPDHKTPANSIIRKSGKVICKLCEDRSQARYRERKKAQRSSS